MTRHDHASILCGTAWGNQKGYADKHAVAKCLHGIAPLIALASRDEAQIRARGDRCDTNRAIGIAVCRPAQSLDRNFVPPPSSLSLTARPPHQRYEGL